VSLPRASFWDRHVLPFLVEKACRSHVILDERRRSIPRASGRVLEVGVGSGLNLAFYDASRATRVTGLDPSAELLARARERASARGDLAVDLVRAVAESLPFDDASFDCAVTTYTLCSVDDPARALAEIRRVLAPGAPLHFVEHGLAPDAGPAAWQSRITPMWRRVGGNCHLDRDLPRALRDAGFTIAEMSAQYTEDSPRWLSYTFEGVARNAA
jgi:ubiquinone/menaquinone biosynthesis C-methylase UbiE